ncbi:MAG: hypothetical protein GY719_18515 [bacterium]|nr:hypothetical protein [bacterium]
MNWQKAILTGVVGGIALSIVEFVMHVLIMGSTYAKYPDVFTQGDTNPLYFTLVALCISIFAAIFFAKTRQCWADGFKGGATYGFFFGLVAFWVRFYDALIYEGFPYYLSWCQGGIVLINMVIVGGVMGMIYKRA